ncbi:MAG: VOC family protein [Burkholderiaceae bacterium]|nr:VOC family protein [Burkholderiaceae bacterium]
MSAPMTSGTHHIGLTVSRLDESADFFTSTLGWKEVKRNAQYPAVYVSDGRIMLSLWAIKKEPSIPFDRARNVGLHHLALLVEREDVLDTLHDRLASSGIEIEFSPEPLGSGPARHMMCREPSGVRVEFIWPGS